MLNRDICVTKKKKKVVLYINWIEKVTLTMNNFLFIVLCSVVVTSALAAETRGKDNKYSNKYNDFDLDSVLNNERILKSYVKCLLGEGSCTKEGRELAQIVPDAIKSECSKCDEKQKAASVKVLKFLNDKHPDLLTKLLKKYDPTGEYEKKYREQILKAAAESSTTTTTKPSTTKSA